MAKKWMQKAFSKNKGALRRSLGAKKGHNINARKLSKATHAKGKLGQRARLAARRKGK